MSLLRVRRFSFCTAAIVAVLAAVTACDGQRETLMSAQRPAEEGIADGSSPSLRSIANQWRTEGVDQRRLIDTLLAVSQQQEWLTRLRISSITEDEVRRLSESERERLIQELISLDKDALKPIVMALRERARERLRSGDRAGSKVVLRALRRIGQANEDSMEFLRMFSEVSYRVAGWVQKDIEEGF